MNGYDMTTDYDALLKPLIEAAAISPYNGIGARLPGPDRFVRLAAEAADTVLRDGLPAPDLSIRTALRKGLDWHNAACAVGRELQARGTLDAPYEFRNGCVMWH